jgi:hypothetical protein
VVVGKLDVEDGAQTSAAALETKVLTEGVWTFFYIFVAFACL